MANEKHITNDEKKRYHYLKDKDLFFLETQYVMHCADGDLSHIQYMHEKKLIEDEKIILNGLFDACEYGQNKIIHYILHLNILKSHRPNFCDQTYEKMLKAAILHKQPEVINYLVYEFKIPYEHPEFPHLNSLIEKHTFLKDLFLKRELCAKLNKELEYKDNSICKRQKI